MSTPKPSVIDGGYFFVSPSASLGLVPSAPLFLPLPSKSKHRTNKNKFPYAPSSTATPRCCSSDGRNGEGVPIKNFFFFLFRRRSGKFCFSTLLTWERDGMELPACISLFLLFPSPTTILPLCMKNDVGGFAAHSTQPPPDHQKKVSLQRGKIQRGIKRTFPHLSKECVAVLNIFYLYPLLSLYEFLIKTTLLLLPPLRRKDI